VFPDDDDYFQEDDSQEMKLEFLQYKRNYYISKLHVDEISTQFLEMYCKEYIRAIQWVLLYYYKGVSSWGWFYPFHYAPFASDLKKFTNYTIEFDKGQPFRPFEQLLAVLPSQSKKLLPACYQVG
jgi:5'-3' exoribonuclease 1